MVDTHAGQVRSQERTPGAGGGFGEGVGKRGQASDGEAQQDRVHFGGKSDETLEIMWEGCGDNGRSSLWQRQLSRI